MDTPGRIAEEIGKWLETPDGIQSIATALKNIETQEHANREVRKIPLSALNEPVTI